MILSSVREVLWKRSVGVLKINKRTPPPEFVGAAVRAKKHVLLCFARKENAV